MRSRAARMTAGLIVCAAGGALFAWIHSPLPWMIGSIVAMAAAQILGANLEVKCRPSVVPTTTSPALRRR